MLIKKIKKGLLLKFIAKYLSKKIKLVNNWQRYNKKVVCPCTSCATALLNDEESARDNHVFCW